MIYLNTSNIGEVLHVHLTFVFDEGTFVFDEGIHYNSKS